MKHSNIITFADPGEFEVVDAGLAELADARSLNQVSGSGTVYVNSVCNSSLLGPSPMNVYCPGQYVSSPMLPNLRLNGACN